jgi:hypothetical protein
MKWENLFRLAIELKTSICLKIKSKRHLRRYVKMVKKYPYIIITVILAILKITGIIDIEWIWVLLPIWWWWPIVISIGVLVIVYMIIEEIITR